MQRVTKRSRSRRSALDRALVALAAALILSVAACEAPQGGGAPVKTPAAGERDEARGRDAARRGPGAAGAMPAPRRQPGASWSIVLGTFTGPDHERAAAETRSRLVERLPEFGRASVRSTPRGSMILWGQYTGPEDSAAQAELKRLHAYEWQGGRPFARAFLTRPETTRTPPTNPLDLRNLRRANPRVDPLHTLQVAVWADFDGTMPLEVIRRSAEGYAAQLRAKGFDAWFHHDDDLMMSVVTVGAFGADAYDPKSTLYHPDVEKLMRRFPTMLVNGETLLVRLEPKRRNSAEVAQKPMLVLVPR